jgi:uncharacterized protein (UPF0332 family)
MDKIKWCKKQTKGIRFVEPTENISNAYLKKARSSLNMLSSAIEKKEFEWIASTAYYARYFAVYSLLMKCGIKCEIHDCTLSIIRDVFKLEKIYEELDKSKKLRVNLQYYVSSEVDEKEIIDSSRKAYDFVLEMEDIISTFNDIERIRNKISKSP